MKPTDKEEQWLWEQCGFKETRKVNYFDKDKTAYRAWFYPKGGEVDWRYALPPIDLNNLFKYAVPKLGRGVCIEFDFYEGRVSWDKCKTWYEGKHCSCCLEIKDREYYGGAPDPALALFWAIYKAFGGSNETN